MTVQALRLLSHDVRAIRGTPDEGIQDDALWEMAQREERLLITTDKGFTHDRTARHYGILVIRLRRPNRHRIHRRIMQAVTQFAESDWPGLLVAMRDVAQSTWRARERP
jgi:predicted nuclease of predicted toxin-antitoxin system